MSVATKPDLEQQLATRKKKRMCAVKLDTRPTARNFKRKIVSEDH